MRRYAPLLILALAFAALLSWSLHDAPPRKTQTVSTTSGPRDVDYYISGLDVTRMTPAGHPAHRLRAERTRHFTDDDTTEMQRPQLTVYQDDAPPWIVTAQAALVSADGELVLLNGDVLIERAADADDPPLRIETRNLRLQPKQDYAETDEQVRVESESDWVDATGMQAWFRPPSRLKFLSQVKGHYVPR